MAVLLALELHGMSPCQVQLCLVTGVKQQQDYNGVLTRVWCCMSGDDGLLPPYGRFENPYIKAQFPAERLNMAQNGTALLLDYTAGTRQLVGAQRHPPPPPPPQPPLSLLRSTGLDRCKLGSQHAV